MRSLLVTGTDTGVGKTHASCVLITALREAGVRVGVMKPCETGIAVARPTASHDTRRSYHAHERDSRDDVTRDADDLPAGSDAQLLRDAARCTAPARDIRPYAFALPAAPWAAAQHAGASMEWDVLDAAFQRLAASHDLVLVEGAGGLLVPLLQDADFADLAARWDLAVLVVARTGLGTLNHTALTVRAAHARGLDVLGVWLNAVDAPVSADDRANLALLPDMLGDVPILGELPHGSAPADAASGVLDALACALTPRTRAQRDSHTTLKSHTTRDSRPPRDSHTPLDAHTEDGA